MGKWSSKYWLSSFIGTAFSSALIMVYNWTDYHVLTDASTTSPVPIRLL